jgi:hypothetical protein
MGFRQRQQEKVRQRGMEFVASRLLPGEEVLGVTFGQARPRWWFGLEMLFGVIAQVFATTWLYLILTDQRLFLVRATKGRGRPAELVWSEPYTNLAVERFKRGMVWMLLYLRRVSDGQVIRFRVQRTSPGSTARITEAADAIGAARAGLPV